MKDYEEMALKVLGEMANEASSAEVLLGYLSGYLAATGQEEVRILLRRAVERLANEGAL